MSDSAAKTDGGKSFKLYYYDRDLKMFLPFGGKCADCSEIELDTEAETPKDRAGLSFIKIKGKKNLYVASTEVAKA